MLHFTFSSCGHEDGSQSEERPGAEPVHMPVIIGRGGRRYPGQLTLSTLNLIICDIEGLPRACTTFPKTEPGTPAVSTASVRLTPFRDIYNDQVLVLSILDIMPWPPQSYHRALSH